MAPDASARAAFARGVLKIAAGKVWRDVTIFDIAEAASVDVASLAGLSPADAADVLDDHFDRAAAEGVTGIDAGQLPRDRIFDLCMKRFEAMEPHRAALLALEKDRDGVAVATAYARAGRTARWLLTLAGERIDGVDGAAQVQALAVTLTRAHQAWKQDADGDFAKTMAALDKSLRQTEDWGERLGFMRKRRDAPPSS
jgi:hypothetical protein